MDQRSTIQLRPARPGEHALLTDLCMLSKASWGYDQAFMDACRKELTLTPKDCTSPSLIVVERGGTPVGLGEILIDQDGCFLEKLFVDPDHQHAGIGRMIFHWAIRRAAELDQTKLIIEADPGAEGFYEICGATRDGFAASQSIAGRKLPRLIYTLA